MGGIIEVGGGREAFFLCERMCFVRLFFSDNVILSDAVGTFGNIFFVAIC